MTTEAERQEFLAALWQYYEQHGRHELPWRQPEVTGDFDPYKIMVSEIMLQQTQVQRVIPKYLAFIKQFPDVQSLAAVSLGTVITAWSGLGYNRRAKFLWQAAQVITNELNSTFPTTVEHLVKLPGIGANTAGAIMAYAFNKPVIFIETNIRTVYFYHFFSGQAEISDKTLLPTVETTVDKQNPREFYWALMDYGAYLKQTNKLNKLSKHYIKQSKFEGSKRQIRGQVLRELGLQMRSFSELATVINDDRLLTVLEELVNEAMIVQQDDIFALA